MGLTVEEFWALTPRETAAVFEAFGWRAERERERDVWLAWHMAALVRTKNMPKLEKLLKPATAPKPLTGDELARRRREFAELKERMGVKRGR